MNARSIRRRTASPCSTKLVIVLMAVALLMSFAPLTGGRAAAEDAKPQPVQPTNLVLNQNIPTPTPQPQLDLVARPAVTPVVIDDFTVVTPEPTEEIGGLTLVPTVEIFDPEFEILDVSLAGHAYECTLGVDIEVLPTGDLATECANPLGVTFTILNSDNATSSDHVGTDVLVNTVEIVGETSIFAKPHGGYTYNYVRAVCTDVAGAEIFNGGAALGGPWFNISNNMHIDCNFYIAPTFVPGDGQVELHKWLCPESFIGATWDDYLNTCTMTMNDVEFHATLNGNDLGSKLTGQDGDGTIFWTVEGSGELIIQEVIPAGFVEPVLFCGFGYSIMTEGGIALASGQINPDAMNNGVLFHEFQEGEGLYCDVFNVPNNDPGSITVVKHNCVAGYDVNAPGANPWLDCTEVANGVTFTVQGFEYWSQSDTGDVTDGQAYFGGLIPGTFGIFETVPADTWYVIAYQCFDANTGAMAPTMLYELENGNTMYVDLLGGQDLVCHFMNVPELHGGTVIITKYWCDGEVYTIWTCDIYEGGASFTFDGGWGPIPATTGADGITVLYLDPGAYELNEVSTKWCFAEASNVDWEGNIVVVDGGTTYVNVFNCGDRPHKTPETPGKFPNTGVKP